MTLSPFGIGSSTPTFVTAAGAGRTWGAAVARRGLGRIAAGLGMSKAGAVYPRIEPRFPAARMVTMPTRAARRIALAERGADAVIRAAQAPDSNDALSPTVDGG